jgi:hypothetical protein
MAAKRPKGELPKRTSGYADYLKERRPNITKSAAAAQAGRVRDKGYDTSAFKKETTKLKQTNLDKTAGTRNKAGASTVAAVAKRFGVTAREARDIATALGTVAGRAVKGGDATGKGKDIANLKKQIKEVGVAAKTGKKGTTSDIEGRTVQMPKGSGRYKVDRTYGYEKGKKRK